MSSKASALFNNNDWKLSVTDINLYENTVSLDGKSYPLSFAIVTNGAIVIHTQRLKSDPGAVSYTQLTLPPHTP
ncbi:hypothetical protein AUS32_24705 [Escherichia coli]|nr:hypothetical protein AUS32_24705 [Escherichia coli]